MATFICNGAVTSILNKGIDWDTDDIRFLLVDATGGTAADPDDDFVADVSANECGATNYARTGSTSGRTTTNPADGSDIITLDAADITFTALGNGTNETVGGGWFYLHTGSDATARLIIFVDFTNRLTDGQDFPVIFNSSGIIRIDTTPA